MTISPGFVCVKENECIHSKISTMGTGEFMTCGPNNQLLNYRKNFPSFARSNISKISYLLENYYIRLSEWETRCKEESREAATHTNKNERKNGAL